MITPRVIPCLLLRNGALVKTVRFRNPGYIGDPINAVKIYNEKEVDELIFLDIGATLERREPHYDLIADIASECFMPFTYCGGVTGLEQMRKLFALGAEKVALNSAAYRTPDLVRQAAREFGSQAVVVSIDVKRGFFGRYGVYVQNGRVRTGCDPVLYARQMVEAGAGELLLTSVDRDGTMQGYDLELIASVAKAVDVPVVASGGAGSITDLQKAVKIGGASAVAAGSMVVYYGRNRAVLINFPSRAELDAAFG